MRKVMSLSVLDTGECNHIYTFSAMQCVNVIAHLISVFKTCEIKFCWKRMVCNFISQRIHRSLHISWCSAEESTTENKAKYSDCLSLIECDRILMFIKCC